MSTSTPSNRPLPAAVAQSALESGRPTPGFAGLVRLMLLAVAGIVAASVSSILIDRVHGETSYFRIPKEVTDRFPPMGTPIPQEVLDLNDRTQEILDYKNTALSLGIAGLALCGLFGLAAGLGRKSALAGISGLLAGIVLGTAFGIAAGATEAFIGLQLKPFETLDATFKAIVMHLSAWLVLGIGVGLVIGFVYRDTLRTSRMIAAAVSGGLVAGVLYAPLAAVLFAGEKSEQLVPTGRGNKIFWLSLTAILMSLALHRSGARRKPLPEAPAANKI